ncbi:uncharacterized protein [Amphiura filiformis]|uniref:uncharacterized protein n=1 Tax=Amphiura filiformis TaxID=82378 RepID=UPI003B215CF4
MVKSHPYLGVHLQDDLGWNSHIGHATSKARRMQGVISRNLYSCPQKLKETAYFSFVRPHVEYACTVWDPHQKNHKTKIERVQRNAARFVKSNYERTKGTVTNFLQDLGWQPLEDRRRAARLTLMYKITNNEVDIPSDHYLTPVTRPSRRNNSKSFLQHQKRLSSHNKSFFPRTIIDWNSLQEDIVKAPSVQAFKNHLYQINQQ